jgi:dicarboxylate transporter 10
MPSPVLTTTTPAQAGAGQAIPPPALSQPKKRPHPFWLGGVAATIAASITQ